MIPTIHIKDLSKLIIKVSESTTELRYILAIDNSNKKT